MTLDRSEWNLNFSNSYALVHFDYADESFRPYKQIKETGNYGIFQLKIQTKTSLHSPKNKKKKQAK